MDKNNRDMEIVTTPTFTWLAERAKSCASRMLIGCPYVNNAIVDLADKVSRKVSRTLITRIDLRNFAMGSSSLDSLCVIAKNGMLIRSLDNLHAKVYIFDNVALVTSANATFNGLYRNKECGLGTNDKYVVERLARSLLEGLGADKPPRKVKMEELNALRIPLKSIKVFLHGLSRDDAPIDNMPAIDAGFSISDEKNLLSGFKGWQKLVLRGVLAMPTNEFDIDKLFIVCKPEAIKRYRNNSHKRQKLSEELQKLRDLGFVEFVKPGHYRRTMDVIE